MAIFHKLAVPICLIFLIFSFSGCNSLCSEKEIHRKTSPDDIVDVVVIERDCGATTSVSTDVYIVPKGVRVEKQSPVFVGDHLESLDVRWAKSKLLLITYADARIFKYRNFWNSGNVDNFNYIVNIRESQK